MKIYVDDIRTPEDVHSWYIVRDMEKALGLVKAVLFDTVSLDHDMGEDQKDGAWFMNQLELHVRENPGFMIPTILFHTDNPVGRKNMSATLGSIQKFKREYTKDKFISVLNETNGLI